YFHGDDGAGLGASHQTGWTGLVARLIQLFGQLEPERLLAQGTTPLTVLYRSEPALGPVETIPPMNGGAGPGGGRRGSSTSRRSSTTSRGTWAPTRPSRPRRRFPTRWTPSRSGTC